MKDKTRHTKSDEGDVLIATFVGGDSLGPFSWFLFVGCIIMLAAFILRLFGCI